jgi:hypothetical protein
MMGPYSMHRSFRSDWKVATVAMGLGNDAAIWTTLAAINAHFDHEVVPIIRRLLAAGTCGD